MQLPLNPDILRQHVQKYSNSCVPMGVELTLKLMNAVDVNYYELQDEKGDVSRWGGDYDSKTIENILIQMEFDFPRNQEFPLEDLFTRIKAEVNAGRFVNCAWRLDTKQPFHAYVIYGYINGEFLAVTKFHKNPNAFYVNDMKTKLKNIQGSDIITFKPRNI